VQRLSINELTSYRWSFDQDVLQAAAAGADGLGIWREKLSDFGEEKGAELLLESGLQASCLLWAGGFTGSDGRRFADSLADAREAIELAQLIGSPVLVLHSGGRGGHTQRHATRLLETALAELLPVAREANVVLALEPMPAITAADWTILNDLAAAMELVQRIEHPALKLVVDTYHWGQLPGLEQMLAELVPCLALVHLADGRTMPDSEQQRCPLGKGRRPLSRLIQQLEQAGYRGWYDVKLMGEEIAAGDYRQLLEQSVAQVQCWMDAAADVTRSV
jgi:sugar phosphate isomerase/epimerase